MVERKQLSAVVEQDGRLRIGGEKWVYERGHLRRLQLVLTKLALRAQAWQPEDGNAEVALTFTATATVYRDVLTTAWGDRCRDIEITLRRKNEAPEGSNVVYSHQWTYQLGFLPKEPDFAWEDSWFFDGFLPAEVFDVLLVAHRKGEVRQLFMMLAGEDYWREPIGYEAPKDPVRFYLVPPPGRPSTGPEPVHGKIVDFVWTDAAPDAPVSEANPLDVRVPEPAPPAPEEVLGKRVDALRDELVRAGWIIAAAVLVGAVIVA